MPARWKLLILSLVVGCQSTQPSERLPSDSTTFSLTEEHPPCTAFHQAFSPLSIPLEFPMERAGDPFLPNLQAWWRARLWPEAVYAPIGTWSASSVYKLWVIEVIRLQGSFAYGVLVDSTCAIRDTLALASLQVGENAMHTVRSYLDANGRIARTLEARTTTFGGGIPETKTSRETDLYRIDWERGRFVAL